MYGPGGNVPGVIELYKRVYNAASQGRFMNLPYAARSIYVFPRSTKQLFDFHLILRLDIGRVHLCELKFARYVVVDAVPVGVRI